MPKNKDSFYDLNGQQRQKIDSKLRELLEICQIERVPMFATCAVKNDAGSTEYANVVYSAQSHDMRLTNDRIRKHMLIASGSFEAVPAREAVVFDPFGVLKEEKDGEQ